MTDDLARILDRARDETPDVLDEVIAETRDLTPGQAAERLAALGAYIRLSGRQRLEQALLGQHVTAASRAMAAYQSGNTALYDQARPAPGGSMGGQRRPGGSAITDRARRVIDARFAEGSLPDYGAARAAGLLSGTAGVPAGLAAAYVEAAGNPAYLRCFASILAGERDAAWEPEEREAYRAVRRVMAASMSEGAGLGQEMIPLTLDPSIHLSSAGSVDPMRRISRVVQTMTNQWRGVTSSGAAAEWHVEAASVADGSPPLGETDIKVIAGDSFASFSFELQQDAVGFTAQLQTVLDDAAVQLQATAFAVGTGTGQPAGAVTGATAVSQLPTGAVTSAPFVQLQNSLGSRWQPRAQWCMNLAVINTVAQFQTANGSLLFPSVQNDPSTLLRKPLNECSNMSADLSTAGSRYALYGDFSEMVIVDRVPSFVEVVPQIFSTTTGRPTMQRGALLWFRCGAGVQTAAALHALVKA